VRATVTRTAGDWNRCHDGDGDVVLIVSATDLFHARQLLSCLPPPPTPAPCSYTRQSVPDIDTICPSRHNR